MRFTRGRISSLVPAIGSTIRTPLLSSFAAAGWLIATASHRKRAKIARTVAHAKLQNLRHVRD